MNLNKDIQSYCNRNKVKFKRSEDYFILQREDCITVKINQANNKVQFEDAEEGESTDLLAFVKYQFPPIDKIVTKTYFSAWTDIVYCPHGHPMKIRINRKDNSKFYGCSQWPQCTFTKPYSEDD